MLDDVEALWTCPNCGHVSKSNDELRPRPLFGPWNVMLGRVAVMAYVASLGQETHEWLLALYVDRGLHLLAVDAVARGTVTDVEVPFWKLIDRGHRLKADAFILVHNHPSGDPRPSTQDVLLTRRLEDLSKDAELPLLNHFIVAGDDMWIIK